MTQDTMTFKREWFDAISVLPTTDMQADAALAIIRYAFTGDIDCDRPFSEALVGMIKDQIDISAKRREAGRAGGKSKANRKQNCSKSVANGKQIESTPLSPSSLSPEPPITTPPISPNIFVVVGDDAHTREEDFAHSDEDPYGTGQDPKEKSCAKKERTLPSGTWVASKHLAEVLLDDKQWMEDVSTNKEISLEELQALIKEFCTRILLTEEGKEIPSAKRHFINWLDKRKLNGHEQRKQQYFSATRPFRNPEPDFEGIKAFVARGIASAKPPQ